jgi:hypothetical protein
MDTEILVGASLTQELLDDGQEMLALMARSGRAVLGAYWQFNTEAQEWRLHVAPDEREDDEQFQGIRQVLRALDSIPRLAKQIALFRLQIRSRDDLLYKIIREDVLPAMRQVPHWVNPELYCYRIS